jgi:hypothetical protein
VTIPGCTTGLVEFPPWGLEPVMIPGWTTGVAGFALWVLEALTIPGCTTGVGATIDAAAALAA